MPERLAIALLALEGLWVVATLVYLLRVDRENDGWVSFWENAWLALTVLSLACGLLMGLAVLL